MQTISRILAAIAMGCTAVSAASWLTFGGDAQRSGWAKEESSLTKDNVKGLQLEWKIKLDNEAKELNGLTVPVVINPVYTNHGSFEYVIVGGSSDNLYAIDADTGKVAWQKHFTNEIPAPKTTTYEGSYFCPQALNDTPVISTSKPGPTAYVISIDGKLHALNVVNGEDRFPPQQFVPAYSKNWSLNLSGDTVYTTISQNCNNTKNGVAAMDVKSADKTVSFFQADTYGGGIWGRGGVAIGSTGMVYAATGDGPVDANSGKYADTVLALSGKDLKLLDYFLPANANYLTRKDLDMGNTSPVIFPYKGRELLVTAGKEGTLVLLDAKALGGEAHNKPLFQARYLNEENDIAGRGVWGAFATWEDPSGTRWIYAPAWGPLHSKAQTFPVTNGATPNGSLMAFKVEDKDGQPALTPAWVSRDMEMPEPPVVANGVVFVVSSGEFTRQIKENGQLYTTKERIENSKGNATLYALDAATGKELYSSGKTMQSFTHFGGLAVNDGRVFLTTHDSTIYAFSVKGE
ncbi:MAG: PQQ-binding-like beta-propeller repeat protein [Acidobacteriaceae bacterium]|nr:PQQ-binding-like beta-propeller repeat protein [Acidobacteriaceae bacterium]